MINLTNDSKASSLSNELHSFSGQQTFLRPKLDGLNDIFIQHHQRNHVERRSLEIAIFLCQNTTENGNSCKSEEDRAKFLNMIDLQIYLNQNTVERTRLHHKPTVKSNFEKVVDTEINPKLYIIVRTYMRQNSLQVYNSRFTGDVTITNFTDFDEALTSMEYKK